ncbi:uroporphyrinogen-III C-methyltransferase [Vibrio sp. DW001]|uniref:uroporphyrinogen-III C-methyltransferase n=1 Tax=Vibrio sp. DW001 TaxID=2912315 RepID=UPI0023AF6C30|nr:uroporphyrinogen-III C-methyltransferase [Vibrio sp. DW001]WED28891.1 uroporphyrinogen-III C-methyltransferase [Vibrio sp. DW001]
MTKGKVYLIGAGPGDPGLLTCRAKQLLSTCDVVCYDKLVSAAILSIIPEHVQLHQVGYRGYQGIHIEYGMHPDVTEFALAGKRVARLKAGDPCIFGRITEECRDLKQHDIPYEIIPGITAALGAASYSGFPLTSGGVASSVTFVSGHKNTETLASWSRLGQAGGTLVLYMGAKKLAQHTQNLIENGRSSHTPIALICSATSADHQCITGTLGTIAEKVEQSTLKGPALVIVGEVVAQAEELNWRNSLPLTGVRMLVCGQYEEIAYLRDKGAEVIAIENTRVSSLIDKEDLDYLATAPELAFSDLPSFNLWWNAVQEYHWDIRKFAMPLGSNNRFVRMALKNMGIQAEKVSDNALTLTVNEEKAFGEKNRYYLVGRVNNEPLSYTIPMINWLLVEDIAVLKSIISHHSNALESAQLVPLNEEVRQWAIHHGYLLDNIDYPDFVDMSDVLSSRECADVA